MSVQNSFYCWSDNWLADDNKIWFMTGETDRLFCFDKDTKECVLVSEIPENSPAGFRGHSRSVKKENRIFCLPNFGENIWCYDISCGLWEMIPVKNGKETEIFCWDAWLIQDKLYAVSRGLRKILELDIQTRDISYHEICADTTQIVSGGVLKDRCIYIVCSSPASIYKFDCSDKKKEMYLLSEIHDQLQTICFDGRKFWMSGRKKKIYVWEEETGETTILDGFPDSFGIYNFSGKYEKVLNCEEVEADVPMFQTSVYVGSYVWFIPFQTNKILYIDKDDFSINVFPMENEEQTEEDVAMQLLQHKYLLEYVWDGRYIGLYSLKNRWMLEIDSRELQYHVMDYNMTELEMLLKMLEMEGHGKRKNDREKKGCIGRDIYLAIRG